MSILERIRSAVGGSAGTSGTSSKSIIVDGETFLRPPSRNGNTGPRDKLAVLRRLAPFVEKEGIAITVVFLGQPLREAADGSQYRGINVHYGEGSQETSDVIVRLLKKISRDDKPVVITADPLVEKRLAGSGAQIMQSSSLRRALDAGQPPPQQSHGRPRNGKEEDVEDEPDEDDGDKIVRELIDPL